MSTTRTPRPSSSPPQRESATVGDQIDVEYRSRVPHPGARRRQRLEFPLLVRSALEKRAARDGRTVDSAAIDAEVERSLENVRAQRLNIEKALDEVEPRSAARAAGEVNRDVETAAVLQLPMLLWVSYWLTRAANGPRSMPMWRPLAAAVGLHMGFAPVKPCASRILERFCSRLSIEAWQHRYPGAPPSRRNAVTGKWDLSAFHKQLKLVLSPRNPFRVWHDINRQLVLELLGEHTVHPRHGGRFANVPDALKYLVVDAVLIEADLPQRKPVSPEHARLMRGWARARTGYIQYASLGVILKRCHGYKWLQISSLHLGGLVLIGRLVPANANERTETLRLLDELYARWPEFQDQKEVILVGDALYDQCEEFAYELVFRFGIHPCFPRAGTIGRTHAHGDTGGVPTCDCGKLAQLDEAADFPTPHWRRTRRKEPAGEWMFNASGGVVDNARLRWKCADKTPGCQPPDTYPRENGRLYTWLPYNGDHSRAALRAALLCYRNVIESSFSVLKEMGLAGRDQMRPRWAGDDQMDHLCWMAATTMSARRVVHNNGLYEDVYAEAEAAGLLQAPTRTDRGTLTNLTQSEAAAEEARWRATAEPPPDWPALDELDLSEAVSPGPHPQRSSAAAPVAA